MGEELAAFLNTLRVTDERQLKAVVKALRTIIPTVTNLDIRVNNLGEVELSIVEGSASIPARVISEGTLRVLGLLSLGASREPISLIGFEEPENGVHPHRIRLIAELLKTRASQQEIQLIVTTHSPILPDLIPDEYLYVCQKRNGITRIQPFSIWGELGRKTAIEGALQEVEPPSVSHRILRGDFDA
jgi:predicted ATPase